MIEREWLDVTEQAFAEAINDALRKGTLVSVERLPSRPGRASARVVLRRQPVRRRQALWRQGLVQGLVIAAGLEAAAVVLVWLLWSAAAWVADHWATLLGAAVVVLLVGAVVVRVSGGGGSGHCSGPNSGH